MGKKISYYEIIITTTNRRLANDTKRRVDRYDMNLDAKIKVVYEDSSRCPKCQRVLREKELVKDEQGQEYCLCGEIIDFDR